MTRPLVVLAAVITLGSLITPDADATDGYFDTTFPAGSGTGRFTFNGNYSVTTGSSSVQTSVTESNGRILLGGPWSSSMDSGWWLGELLADGEWNPPWGAADGSGRVTNCQIGSCVAANLSDALPAVGGGYAALTNYSVLLTDATAHTIQHSISLPFAINDAGGIVSPNTLLVLPDGKILAAGTGKYEGISTAFGIGVARLTSSLTLDPTFNAVNDGKGVTFSGGTVVTVFNTDTSEMAYSILRQADGRIVVAGVGTDAVNFDLVLIRLNSDGTLDGTFGDSGVKQLPIDGHEIGAMRGVIDRNDQVILGITNPLNGGLLIVRVGTNGNTFEPYSTLPSGCTFAHIASVALDSAGRILAAGYCQTASSAKHFLVLRLRDDKTFALDTSFGIAGVSLGWYDSATDIASSQDNTAYRIVLDGGGRPLVAGSTFSTLKSGVARLTYDLVYTDQFEPPAGCLAPNCN